jgi:hypothetical protein
LINVVDVKEIVFVQSADGIEVGLAERKQSTADAVYARGLARQRVGVAVEIAQRRRPALEPRQPCDGNKSAPARQALPA